MTAQFVPFKKSLTQRIPLGCINVSAELISFGKYCPAYSYLSIEYSLKTQTIRFTESDRYNGYHVSPVGTTPSKSYRIKPKRFLDQSGLPRGLYMRIDELTYQNIDYIDKEQTK